MAAYDAFVGADCPTCTLTRDAVTAFTMAFQPIVDLERRVVIAQEALLRGSYGEAAAEVLAQVRETGRQDFDCACRNKAVDLAGRLFPLGTVSINLLPAPLAQAEPALRSLLERARQRGLDRRQLIVEVSEIESVRDPERCAQLAQSCRELDLRLAIDDFGSGHSGLILLQQFRPQYIKLDMSLVRELHRSRVRRLLLRCILDACRDAGCEAIAEGVESREELHALRELGVRLMQGFYFARPALEAPGLVPAEFLS